MTDISVAVLTNGSLLFMPEVRNDLKNADLVIPTLCSVDQETFTRIHRGHASLSINQIIEGYVEFRAIFTGKIWLELMFMKGINDTLIQIEKIKKVIDRIMPDKIHLNTVVRPPSEEYARAVSLKTLQGIKKIIGAKCEIIAEFKSSTAKMRDKEQLNKILAIVKRRPITLLELSRITGAHENEIVKSIDTLLKQGKIEISRHDQKDYYRIQRGSDD
jgi:wyosine [tRNA(Phe)-imidazoG37] synthetase (radical SAM superfamily)